VGSVGSGKGKSAAMEVSSPTTAMVN
jgi:hypothetical protein